MEPKSSGRKTHDAYTVAVVCAMSFEMSAVRFMLDREHHRLPTKPGDSNMYTLGDLHGHNVVLACLPGQQGKGAAATVAANMSRTFPSIKWRFLVGIGGGVPSDNNDIRLGDVVVSMPEGIHGGVVQSAVEQMRSDHLVFDNKIQEYLVAMFHRWPRLTIYNRPSEPDVLYCEDYRHPTGALSCADCDRFQTIDRMARQFECPTIHYGLIASGDRVLKSAMKRIEIVQSLGNVLCLEMEAAGIMSEFPCIVIRGISDYADSHKNDIWQHFAAAAAAACTKELLSYVDADPASVEDAPSSTATSKRDEATGGHVFHGRGVQHTGSGSFSIGGI
ncbi:hypothetical protein TrVFT333_004679 [Trichoderma virens FT-333]|nr:hypothetical protein TrVFT333_004679 [Trichoderma virens FT-333]